MSKESLLFLLILLVAKQIYCCPSGEVLNYRQCEQCLPPKVISLNKLSCEESCSKQEIITTQITDDNITFQQCSPCPKESHHILKINDEPTCMKKCEENEVLDYKFQCIDPSKCNGFVKENEKICVETCKNQIIYISDSKPYKECVCFSNKKKLYKDGQWYSFDKCPDDTITDSNNRICLQSLEECTDFISADEKSCVKFCGELELVKQNGKYKYCEKGCVGFEYKYISIMYCADKCPEGYIVDKKNNKCYVSPKECKVAVSSDEKQCVESCEEKDNIFDDFSEFNNIRCLPKCHRLGYEYQGKKYCTNKCPENMVTDSILGKCHTDTGGCSISVSVDGKNCVKSCNTENRESIVDKKCTVCSDYYLEIKQSCQKTCPQGLITDREKKLCYINKSDCKGKISFDETQCVGKCDEQNKEKISQKNGYKKCEVCEDFYVKGQYGDHGYCLKECHQNQITIIPLKICAMDIAECSGFFISKDEKSCDSKCTDSLILKEGKCVSQDECSGNNEILDETKDQIECKNKVDKEYSCELESSDGRKCVNSCNEDKLETVVSKKCTVCNDIYLSTDKSCNETCPKGQITDKARRKCYKTKYECPDFISSDGKQCLSKCDSTNKEVPVKRFNLKNCEICENYFTAEKNGAPSTCEQQCSDNQITIISTKTCTTDLQDCSSFFMSADRRSCDTKCDYPYILKKGNCVTNYKCYGVDEIIDETTDQIECKNKKDEGYSCKLESSDGRRCVNSCLLSRQREKLLSPLSSSIKCENCGPFEKFFLIHENNQYIGGCKESISFQENKNIYQYQLENVKTLMDFKRFNVMLTDYIISLLQEQQPEGGQILSVIQDLSKKFLQTLMKSNLLNIKYNLHQVGSSKSVIVFLQLIQQGKGIQNSFDSQSFLTKTPLDLTEINKSNTYPDQNGILLCILKNNPLCKQDSCKNFPVVYAVSIDLRTERKLSAEGQTPQYHFEMKQHSDLYVCLHYNNELTQVIAYSIPTIHNFTLSCPINGPTQVEIDETCKYIQSMNCRSFKSGRIFRAEIITAALIYVLVIMCV